jgi:hypothetical protein
MTTDIETQGSMTQALIWLGLAAVVIGVVAYFVM